MKRLLKYNFWTVCVAVLSLHILTGCNVHEWPVPSEMIDVKLKLEFEPGMLQQEYLFTKGEGEATTRGMDSHTMRYIIRAYPLVAGDIYDELYTEFVYYNDVLHVGEDYNMEKDIALPAGEYRFMVWADFVDRGSEENKYYDASVFTEIELYGDHKANTDYKEAFRGVHDYTLVTTIKDEVNPVILITMQRPLGKFTFVTTDLQEFIDKETRLMDLRGERPDSTRNTFVKSESNTLVDTRGVNLEDYKIIFYYPMYMPNTYDMNRDKAIDATVGVQFESKLAVLNEEEARMGFDYVLISEYDAELGDFRNQAKVTVKVGLFDKNGHQLSMSEPFDVPLKRSVNTIVKGKFLMLDAQGGVSIDPSFDDEFNIPIE